MCAGYKLNGPFTGPLINGLFSFNTATMFRCIETVADYTHVSMFME